MRKRNYIPSSVPGLAEQRPPFGFIEYREYQRQHRAEWPSAESVRWFMRQNRRELVEAGALGLWRGCLVVDPPTFERVGREIMLRGAARMLEK